MFTLALDQFVFTAHTSRLRTLSNTLPVFKKVQNSRFLTPDKFGGSLNPIYFKLKIGRYFTAEWLKYPSL